MSSSLQNYGLSLILRDVDVELTKLHEDLDSRDMTRVLAGLDYLMKNTDGTNPEQTDQYGTLFEHRQDILHSLERLLNVVNPLAASQYPCNEQQSSIITGKAYADSLLMHDSPRWSDDLSNKPQAILRQLAITMDENFVLISILTIIKNMSHEVANEVFVASSYTIMNQCIHIIMSTTCGVEQGSYGLSDASSIAFEILKLVGTKVDLSGKRRMQWSATGQFLLGTGTTSTNTGLSLLYPRYKRHEQQIGFTQDSYVRVVQNLLPWCLWALRQVNSRWLTWQALTIVGRLATCVDNQVHFVRAPDEFYTILLDLVCVSITTAEPLVAKDSSNPDAIGRYRLPPSTCSNFFLDLSEETIRDCALGVMVDLCNNNYGTPTLSILHDRLLSVPNLLPILQRIATPTYPNKLDIRYSNKQHNEGQSKAVQLLAVLQHRAHQNPLYAQDRMGTAIGSDLVVMITHENLVQDFMGERLYNMINKVCEGGLV